MSPGTYFIRHKRSSHYVSEKRGTLYADLADIIRDYAYTTQIAATVLMKRMNVGYAY